MVVYLSKSLNKIKKNYEIYDKKMLVMIRELETFVREIDLECSNSNSRKTVSRYNKNGK